MTWRSIRKARPAVGRKCLISYRLFRKRIVDTARCLGDGEFKSYRGVHLNTGLMKGFYWMYFDEFTLPGGRA